MIVFPSSPQDGQLKDGGASDLCQFSQPQDGRDELEGRIPSPQPRCCTKWVDGWKRRSWNTARPPWP